MKITKFFLPLDTDVKQNDVNKINILVYYYQTRDKFKDTIIYMYVYVHVYAL